jgi:hypothetical protein
MVPEVKFKKYLELPLICLQPTIWISLTWLLLLTEAWDYYLGGGGGWRWSGSNLISAVICTSPSKTTVLQIVYIEGKVNMEHQLDATITVLLISKISSTRFGQTFAHLHLVGVPYLLYLHWWCTVKTQIKFVYIEVWFSKIMLCLLWHS